MPAGKLTSHLCVMAAALWSLFAVGCGARSRLITTVVDAPALRANTVGLSSRQTVVLYLPPSYSTSQRRYPVLYFLPGYDDPSYVFTGGQLQGFRLRDSMDQLTAQGRIEEMIVVLPSSTTPLGGTFYNDSPVLGNWEGYISRELVAFVDRNFRTRNGPGARAIAGTTAGGSGALLLAMRHPDVFGAVYALDPVLLYPGALEARGLCSEEDAGHYLALQEAWDPLPEPQARLQRTLYLQACLGSSSETDHLRAFFVAMGAAFSPDPGRPGLPVRFPYRRTPAGLVADPSVRGAFAAGLGDWEQKAARYGANLRRLKLLGLDYGTDNGIRWLPEGCARAAEIFSAAGIPHRVLAHAGNHEDQLRERMEHFLLPILSEVLHAQ
jgi:S-formylglutathione hydrolase